jgi:hypothetical protein
VLIKLLCRFSNDADVDSSGNVHKINKHPKSFDMRTSNTLIRTILTSRTGAHLTDISMWALGCMPLLGSRYTRSSRRFLAVFLIEDMGSEEFGSPYTRRTKRMHSPIVKSDVKSSTIPTFVIGMEMRNVVAT